MFARVVPSVLLKSACRLQEAAVFRAFTHSYVSSDECILKKGESYHVTETGRKRVHRMRDRREVH